MRDNLKQNLQELGKDCKGIGTGLAKFGASVFCLVKDTLKVPVSIARDIRDGKLEKKDEEPAKTITLNVNVQEA